jgi:hypothetical protein
LKSFSVYEIIDRSLEIIGFWTPNKTLEKGSLSLKHIEICVNSLFSHYIQLVKLENGYISLLFCISIDQEFFIELLSLSNDILELHFMLNKALNFSVQ